MKQLKLISSRVGAALMVDNIQYDGQSHTWWEKQGGDWTEKNYEQMKATVYEIAQGVFEKKTVTDKLGNQVEVSDVAGELLTAQEMHEKMGQLPPDDRDYCRNGLDKMTSKLIELDGAVNVGEISPQGVDEILECLVLQATEKKQPANNAMRLKNGVLEFGDKEARFIPGKNDMPSVNTPYDPSKECPRFQFMMNQLTSRRLRGGGIEEDAETRRVLELYIGATLFPGEQGTPNRQAMWIYGGANTGKSVLINAIANTMGEKYSARGLTTKNFTDEIFRIQLSRRMLCFPEFTGGVPVAYFKAWTGGNPLNARRHYGYAFPIYPNGQIWIESNPKPSYTDDTGAMASRLILLDCQIPYTETEIKALNKSKITQILRDEQPGILNYMLHCWQEYQGQGGGEIELPDRLKSNIQGVEQTNNHALLFFQGRVFVKGQQDASLLEAYKDYQNFCHFRGQRPTAIARFANTFERVYGEVVGGEDRATAKGLLLSNEWVETALKQNKIQASNIVKPRMY